MPAAQVALSETLDTPRRWSIARRFGFRFAFSYFLLYTLPQSGAVNLMDAVPGASFATKPLVTKWHAVVSWVAVHVFRLSGPVTVYPAGNGSGDTTLDYIQVFCYLVMASLATILWSILDRRREDYRSLYGLFRGYLRYVLAFTLFAYGFAKVIPTQFPPPGLSRLIEPYGESSPMGLLWAFMGASVAYTIFSGLAEVAGGALLLFRRTATLGALVAAAALTNIVMLNFCYDVPVKIYSLHLMLMAFFIAAPDMDRLVNVLVLDQPVSAVPPPLRLPRRWMRIGWPALKVLFVGCFIVMGMIEEWTMYKQYIRDAPKLPLYGLYDVENFTRNGQTLPPLLSDTSRWKRVIVERPGLLSVRMMDDSRRNYNATVDEPKKTISLKDGGVLSYAPEQDHVRLNGTVGTDTVDISLRKVDTSKMLLVNRGFHWINERPFNR